MMPNPGPTSQRASEDFLFHIFENELNAAIATAQGSIDSISTEREKTMSNQLSQAYQASEEDVENVLASNQLQTPLQPGETLESLAELCFAKLDFGLIEQAALMGDALDEQTDYANDEIARQLRDGGVLAQEPMPEALRPNLR